jgi:hypothetical protein
MANPGISWTRGQCVGDRFRRNYNQQLTGELSSAMDCKSLITVSAKSVSDTLSVRPRNFGLNALVRGNAEAT